MLKSKSTNRLISKIVLAGLLIGTLPVGLPLRGQVGRTEERKALKAQVSKEIAGIKKTVKRLKIATLAIPAIIAGAGIAVMALAVALVAVLFLSPKLKLRKVLKGQIDKLVQIISTRGIELKSKWAYKPGVILDPDQALLDLMEVEKARKYIEGMEALKKLKIEKLNQLDRVIKGSAIFIGSISIALFGLISKTAVGTFLGLSAASAAAAFKGARKLEQLEKKHPGILTPQDKRVLAQLKKQSKNIITQAIVKNLRLKGALLEAANTAMRQHPEFVKLLGKEKKVRKLFVRYIKLRWQEKLFTESLSEGVHFLKSFLVKLQLKKTKKKIKKLEAKYPQLKASLESAAQTYTAQARGILEEFKGQMIKAGTKGKLPTLPLGQQVVPL